jgi:hypothetical protein
VKDDKHSKIKPTSWATSKEKDDKLLKNKPTGQRKLRERRI